MNTMQPKKSQTTKNEPTQGLWKELSDDVASRYSGGQKTSARHIHVSNVLFTNNTSDRFLTAL